MLVAGILLAGLLATTAAQEPGAPRPLPGNPQPEYPSDAEKHGVTGTVAFRADVTAEGRVSKVRVLRVPLPDWGFERSTERAVKKWRFEPARRGDRPVDSIYVGQVEFRLRPDDEEAVREVVREAFQAWLVPSAAGSTGKVPRTKIQDDEVTPTTLLLDRLCRSFDPSSPDSASFSVDAIHFEGDDAWVTTSVSDPTGAGGRESFRTLMVQRKGRWFAFLAEAPSRSASEKTAHGVAPGLLEKPDPPDYPGEAREREIRGEVVLEIAVELDGTTTVERVIESLPYCTVAAIENTWKWRWKPAVSGGRPVRALGVVTVSFDMFSEPRR